MERFWLNITAVYGGSVTEISLCLLSVSVTLLPSDQPLETVSETVSLYSYDNSIPNLNIFENSKFGEILIPALVVVLSE